MHNTKFKIKNLTTETNSFLIEMPVLNDIKVLNAVIGININNIVNHTNSFTINYSAIQNSVTKSTWTNVDTLKDIQSGQLLEINISDEIQNAYDCKASHLLLKFEGTEEITFANISESDFLNIDYTSLSEYQQNGSYHQIDLGKSGKVSISLNNGDLSFSTPVAKINNKSLPLSISAVYNNSTNKSLPFVGLPSNWQLNAHQFLIKDLDKEHLSFTYIDENGKNKLCEEKYFYKEDDKKIFVPRSKLRINTNGDLTYKLYNNFINLYDFGEVGIQNNSFNAKRNISNTALSSLCELLKNESDLNKLCLSISNSFYNKNYTCKNVEISDKDRTIKLDTGIQMNLETKTYKVYSYVVSFISDDNEKVTLYIDYDPETDGHSVTPYQGLTTNCNYIKFIAENLGENNIQININLLQASTIDIKNIETISESPNGIKLIPSLKDINGSDLVDTEPEELANERNNLKNLNSNKNAVEQSMKICRDQLVIYSLSRYAMIKQIQMQEKNINLSEEELTYTKLIKKWKEVLPNEYVTPTSSGTADAPTLTDDPQEKIAYHDYAFTYGEPALYVLENFTGSYNLKSELLDLTKLLYAQVDKTLFKKLLSENMPEEFYIEIIKPNLDICWKDFYKSQPVISNSDLEISDYSYSNFAFKDLYNIDLQINNIVVQYRQYQEDLNKLETAIKISQNEILSLEQKVPVHYIVKEDNTIYGFGKTYDENNKETNIFRLILITDSYENTILINYESLMSNRIKNIIDSSENVTTFTYSEDNNFLIECTDSQERKSQFYYKEDSNELIKIKAKSSNTTFSYNENKIDYIMSNSGLGTKFEYDNEKVISACEISEIEKIENSTPVYKNKYSIDDNSKITFTYNNINSTSISNKKGKTITYLFDMHGKVKTIYENDFDTESKDNSSNCESEPVFRSNVTNFNYQDKNILLKVTKFPYSPDYFENIKFPDTIVQKACSQSESTDFCNLYLGDDLICGNDAVAHSYLVYHNHYKFIDSYSSASISIEKTDKNDPFSFLKEKCHKMLVLSCWAKADSAFIVNDDKTENNNEFYKNRKFELRAVVHYEDEENARAPVSQSFDWRNTNWQYCTLPIELEKTNVKKITCYFDYSNNTNTINVEFTKPELKLGDFEKTTYNSDKTIASIETGHSEWRKDFKYDDKQHLISETISRVSKKENCLNEFTTYYVYNKNGKLIKSIDFNGIVKETIYNDKGAVVKNLTYHKDEPANVLVEENIFNEHGEKIKENNEFGNKILEYEYKDNTSTLATQIDADGQKTSFGYNDKDVLIEKTTTIDGQDNTTVYGYTLDFLTSLKHNNFEINYNYQGNGKLKEIYIAGLRYLTKEYDINEETTNLENGESYKTIYNDENQVLQIYYKNAEQSSDWNLLVQNIYDIYGNLIFTKDEFANELHKYVLDNFGNTHKVEILKYTKESDSETEILTSSLLIEHDYNENHSNITKTSFTFDNDTTTKLDYEYTLSEDPHAKLLKVTAMKGADSIDSPINNIFEQEIKYDKLNRINNFINKISLSNKILNKEFTYLKQGNRSSNLISKIDYSNNDLIKDRISYKYDVYGNIVEVRQLGELLARYKYDSLCRLIREDNKEFKHTITYEYDGGGNILCKKVYDFTLVDNLDFEFNPQVVSYNYPVSGWRDQLKLFNNQEIKEYDALGNPWIYRDNTLEWAHGRQLKRFGNIADYHYNSNAIRTMKTIHLEKCCNYITENDYKNCDENNEKTFNINYLLDGNKILKQHDCCNDLTFYYGADGITGFHITSENATYEGNNLDHDFFYKKNAQNDIIGIYDQYGNLIIKYYYDAWGNQKAYNAVTEKPLDIYNKNNYTNVSDIIQFIAIKNPFRYRSYYYDFETNLYYLNSRYYDSETGRFINADNINVISSIQNTINALNLYSYCMNNPINETDSNGYFLDSYSEIIDFISVFLETSINLGIAAVGWAIKHGAKPSNIGLGLFLKNQTKQLSSLSKASGILSKVSTGVAIVSIGVSVIEGIVTDINRGYSTGRIISNAVTNTAIYAGITFGSAFIGSKIGALIGSVIPGLGTAIGAVVGFVVGLLFGWLLEIQINGKSIIEHIRDGIYSFWRWLFG